MLHEVIAGCLGLVIQHPMGGIFKGDKMPVLTKINAERRHFIADMGVLLAPQDEGRHLDLGGAR